MRNFKLFPSASICVLSAMALLSGVGCEAPAGGAQPFEVTPSPEIAALGVESYLGTLADDSRITADLMGAEGLLGRVTFVPGEPAVDLTWEATEYAVRPDALGFDADVLELANRVPTEVLQAVDGISSATAALSYQPDRLVEPGIEGVLEPAPLAPEDALTTGDVWTGMSGNCGANGSGWTSSGSVDNAVGTAVRSCCEPGQVVVIISVTTTCGYLWCDSYVRAGCLDQAPTH